MDLMEMQNRLGSIVKEQRSIVDKYQGKEFDADDRAKYDSLEKDFQNYSASIERAKVQEQREAALAATSFQRAENAPSKKEYSGNVEVRALIHKLLRTDPSELSSEIREAQSSLVAADGGNLVPTTLANEIDKALKAFGGIRSFARVLTTSTGNPFDMPTVDDTANGAAIKAQNAADAGATKAAFGKKTFGSYNYTTGILAVPRELIRDSQFNIVPLLTELIVERWNRTESTVLATGTGSSQPEGLVTGASAGVTAAASAITLDNVLDLIHAVDPAYRNAPSFRLVLNDATLKALRKLQNSEGNYVWQMGDVRTGTPSTIFGVQYVVDQAIANIGASAVSMLAGDLSKYIIRDIGSGILRTSDHHFFAEDQLAMVYQKSFDAKVINSAAIKKLTHAAS